MMRHRAIRADDEWCPSPTGRGVVQCWFIRWANSLGQTRARACCSRRRVVVEVIGGGVPYGTRQADRCPWGATSGGLVNGIRGLAAAEYDLDEKHPSKALIRKTLEGSGGPLRTGVGMFQRVMERGPLLKGAGLTCRFHLQISTSPAQRADFAEAY